MEIIKKSMNDFFYKYDFTPKRMIGVFFGEKELQISETKQHKNGTVYVSTLDSMKSNISIDPLVNPEWYMESIVELVNRNKIETKNAAISIPKNEVIIKYLNIPFMETSDIVETFSFNQFWENLVQLEENIDNYFIYYQILKKDEVNKRMEIVFTAAKKNLLQRYIDICNEAGLEVLNISVENSSESNLISHVLETQRQTTNIPFCILKISENSTYFSIVHNNIVYTTDIFINHNEIQELMALEKPAIKTLNRTVDRVSLQIRQILTDYSIKYDIDEELFFDIFIISPMFHGEYYANIFKEKNKSKNIEFVNPFEILQLNKDSKVIDVMSNTSYFATVLGDSLNVFKYFYFSSDKKRKYFNLLPNKGFFIKKFKRIFFLNSFLLVGSVFSFLIFAILYSNMYIKNSKLEKELTTFSSVEEEIDNTNILLNTLKMKNKKLNAQIEYKKLLETKIVNNYEILNSLYDSSEKELWFKDIIIDNINKTLKIEGKTIHDNAVLEFLNELKKYNNLFSKINLENISVENNNINNTKNERIKNFKMLLEIKDKKGK